MDRGQFLYSKKGKNGVIGGKVSSFDVLGYEEDFVDQLLIKG